MVYISSRNNDKIKETAYLKDRSSREQAHRFCFEGVHLFEEYIKFGNKPYSLYVTPKAYEKYKELISPFDDVTAVVDDHVYEKLTSEQAPQGILCVAEYLNNVRYNGELCGRSVILESVRDAGNLGGIIRTALSLGIENIVLSRDCVDIYSSKTVRASMGAIFAANVCVCDDICESVKRLTGKGCRVYACCLYGNTQTLGNFELKKSDSFVFGNEGNGISDLLASSCTGRVIIPMSGKTESMNVAAASAVIMWEMVKANG